MRTIDVLTVFFLIVSCSAAEGRSQLQPQRRLETRDLEIANGATGITVPIHVELARTDAEKQAGLMWRTSLADGEGMLFVYTRDERLSFWMKNTLIPLSIAFISADGRLLEIYDMQPESLRTVSSVRSVRYALEAPQGWFAQNGLAAGNAVIVNLDELNE